MRLFRSARWLLLPLLLSVVPAFLHAQILVSVNFAPLALPVYEQPLCPQPNLMWTPGFWDYADGDYYWVPGAWVPAPYEGALWTPYYWDWYGGSQCDLDVGRLMRRTHLKSGRRNVSFSAGIRIEVDFLFGDYTETRSQSVGLSDFLQHIACGKLPRVNALRHDVGWAC